MKLALILLIITSCTSLLLSTNAQASSALDAHLTSFTGKPIVQDKNKITHLIFIDLWRSYEGRGDEEMLASLPEQFLQLSQQIWLQPEINVTKAQLAEFQQYFPQVTPLVLDHNFALMRAFKVWQAPFHVLLEGKQQLFFGDSDALALYMAEKYPAQNRAKLTANDQQSDQHNDVNASPADKLVATSHRVESTDNDAQTKPLPGYNAPEFWVQSMADQPLVLSSLLAKLSQDQPLSLVFIDSLCPMPHFPGCEDKLAKLMTLIENDRQRQWLGIVNSYYINQQSAELFAKRFKLDLPLVFDHQNKIFKAYEVHATPYQIDINSTGVILSRSEQLH